MHTGCLRFSLISLTLMILGATARAEDTRVQELERKLEERDKVILELLDRVEALEQRTGVQRRPSDAAGSAEQGGDAATVKDPERGGSRAPGAVVVEEGDAERALERSLTREGALLLPAGVLEVEPAFVYSRLEDATPRLFSAGSDLFAGEVERNVDSFSASLALRLGLPWDSQLELGLPYRRRVIESVTSIDSTTTDSTRQSGDGFGDARLGWSKTLLREDLWLPDLTGRLTWDTDTGEADANGVALGGRFHELQGSLTAVKRQDPMVFVGALSYDHTFEEGEVQPGAAITANIGSFIAVSPETSLQFSFTVAHQDEAERAGREIEGSDRLIGSFAVGGSTLLAPGTLLNLSVGIGLTDDADDFSLSLSVPVRLDKRLF